MDVWFHNENVYPFVPQDVLDRADSVRASLPNKYCDPKIAADLFEQVLDEFQLCDEVGKPFTFPFGVAVLGGYVMSFYVPKVTQSLPNSLGTGGLSSCVAPH